MRLKIENLLGIKRAEIDLDGIVEVVGPNASGKSSLAACAQALLTHEQNPLGVSVTQAARVYLHDGADEGLAEIDGVEWRPGKGLTVTNGAGPLSRPAAVGLVDYTARRGEKERLESLQSALLPDVAEIIDAVRERLLSYMPRTDVGGLLEMISERGFDAAAEVYADRGRDSKRQWQEVANRAYGVKVASDWRPDGWLANMDSMTTQQAEEAVTAAREALAALHQVQAVTEAEAQTAAEAKAALPGLIDALQVANNKTQAIGAKMAVQELTEAGRAVKGAEFELAKLRAKALKTKALTCPHCQGFVAMDPEGGLYPYDGEAERLEKESAAAKAEEVQAALAERCREESALEKVAAEARSQSRQAEHEAQEAKTALGVAEKLAGNADAEVETEGRRADLMQAEQAVDDAKRISGMVSAEARAAQLAETVARYAEIVLALGPQGVRAQMMEAGLKKLNMGLEVISTEAGWPAVEVTDRGAVMWGVRPIQVCSASEQWRAQAAIQLTLAAMTGSQAVVLDRADVLDADNRDGLVRAVKRVSAKTGIAVLLCSTGVAGGSAPGKLAPWKQVTIAGGMTR